MIFNQSEKHSLEPIVCKLRRNANSILYEGFITALSQRRSYELCVKSSYLITHVHQRTFYKFFYKVLYAWKNLVDKAIQCSDSAWKFASVVGTDRQKFSI